MVTKARVAEIACEVAQVRESGHRYALVGQVTFDTVNKGWCTRFVRQVHEAALGLRPFGWPYAAPNARECEYKLKHAGCQTQKPEPGDIVCMNYTRHAKGHIGIWLGDVVAHNTSSRNWGPGTVLTPVQKVGDLISGFYSVLPSEATLKVVLLPGSKLLAEGEMPPPGEYDLIDHLADQGKVYLKPV